MSDERPPSKSLRERYEREYLLPLARALFELEPRCQSMLVTVGQYWCDEATDAVHSHEIACVDRQPVWPQADQVRPGVLGDEGLVAEALAETNLDDPEDDSILGLAEVQYDLFDSARKQAFGERFPCVLDDNTDMIVAFAAYCREVSDQEQPSWRSHTPYGLVRRPDPGQPPSLEIIGAMHRPEWEDRWDVLEKDGIISGFDSEGNPYAEDSRARPSSAAHGAPAQVEKVRFDLRLILWLVAAVVLAGLLLGRC